MRGHGRFSQTWSHFMAKLDYIIIKTFDYKIKTNFLCVDDVLRISKSLQRIRKACYKTRNGNGK